MKNKKSIIGLVAVLVCLILLIALLLTQCGTGDGDGDKQLEHSSNVDVTKETVESTQGSTVETTAEPEPTTVETETTPEPPEETEPIPETTVESTEPVPEETQPEQSTGGNKNPGGSGGFVGGIVDDDNDSGSTGSDPSETKPEVDPAGTEKNPYTEILTNLPDAFSSVKIPANGTICYNVYQTENTVLTIEDADAYIIYNGITYSADENGIVIVPLAAGEEDVPVVFQLGNQSAEEEAYAMHFTAPLGSAANPEKLTSLEQITVAIGADDVEGYHYSWTASENGTLTLTLESINPEDAECEILLTLGETVVKLSDSADGTVSLELQEDDEVIIMVSVKPEGTEAEAVLSGSFAPGFGSSENPYVQTILDLPGSLETAEIGAGKELYYDIYVGSAIATIENPNAYVIYGGERYDPDENGVISLTLKPENVRTPVSLIIGNSGEENQSVLLAFAAIPGSINNPVVIEDVSETIVHVPEGNDSGYYLRWIAADDGVLSITAAAEPETVTFDVILNCGDTYVWLSDGSPVSMEVVRGDVVNIQIAIEPDDNWNFPAAKVTLSGSFTISYGTANNPYSEAVAEIPGSISTVEIPAGEAVYYELSNISSALVTIEDSDVYVIYNGVTYMPDESGVLTLEVQAGSTRYPVLLQIGNSGETAESYTLRFTPTIGSVNNPEVVYSLFKLSTNLAANSGGYYYNWTATEDGAVSFWVDEEHSTMISHDIILSSTGSYNCPALSENENKVVSMTVKEGDVVTIQVTDSGSGSAAHLAVRGAFFSGEGTEEHPYMTTVTEVPGGLATVEIVNGGQVNYSIYRIGNTVLTLKGEDAYVIYDGVTYTAEDGVVTVPIKGVLASTPVSLIVGNVLTDQEKQDGQEAATEAYLIRIEAPVGVYGNPEIVEDISSLTTNIKEGNDTGYYYKWTAEEAGTVTFQVTGATEGVAYDICLTSSDSYAIRMLSESTDGTVSMDVEAGSVVTINVTTLPDESGNYPAGVIEVNGSFTPVESSTGPGGETGEGSEPETPADTPPSEPADESETESAGDESSSEASSESTEEEPTGGESGTEPTGEESSSEPASEPAKEEPVSEESGTEPVGEESSSEPASEPAKEEPVSEEPAAEESTESETVSPSEEG
ncbi:MAG: hypothetical protein ACI3W5_06420 [Faecousia sp.]